MTDKPTAYEQHLQQLWREHFPLSNAMDIRVHRFQEHELVTHTALAPNTNIHGSAFAGSLYAIQALTAWGLLYLELKSHNLKASIIHASGQIDFAHPVNEDIVAASSLQDTEFDLNRLKDRGKIRLRLTAEVRTADTLASSFAGDYLARLER